MINIWFKQMVNGDIFFKLVIFIFSKSILTGMGSFLSSDDNVHICNCLVTMQEVVRRSLVKSTQAQVYEVKLAGLEMKFNQQLLEHQLDDGLHDLHETKRTIVQRNRAARKR